jgi:hypothetical protein
MEDRKRPILEILIPTYGRPGRAIEAIDSCLRISSDELRVSCHSNGTEELLQAYSEKCKDQRFSFGWFEVNRGVCANLRKLIDQAVGSFVLILSDEDKLNESGVLSLMGDLEANKDVGVGVALPVIVDSGTKQYFFKSPLKPGLIDPSLAVSMHAWDSSYISGTVFNTDYLKELDLNHLLRKSISNAYPHLSFKLFLLARSKMFVSSYVVVLKGRDEGIGGDAWAHVNPLSENKVSNMGERLKSGPAGSNPDIYGVYARSMQFFSLANDLNMNRSHFPWHAVLWAKAALLVTFLRQIFINESNREERLGDARRAHADFERERGSAINGVLVSLFFWLMWMGPSRFFWIIYALLPKARRLCFGRSTGVYRQLSDRLGSHA